ncbi:MAG TPA: 3-methyl-2-oxobutanoate hydroxymethyltransferase [Candidatus Omnitrophica bacterium]|nr:3-methyl-2-oxobutanoate hydroxymethyltransferase [Candidatus Omnitrophota bacterium]
MRTHKVTIQTLQEMKSRGEPITMLTAYDKNDAALLEDGKVDITFVGDSGGMVRLGLPSTQEVTMDHMVSFALDTKINVRQSLFVVDMPHLSYRTEEEALVNARRLMDAGAETVKLEGGEEVALIVNHLVANGIPVMGHIAYTPQSKGDHKSVGRTEEEAQQLLKDAMAIQKAGAYAVVIELADSEVSAWISKRLKIPTIGIGAGIGTDGQVLVIDDLLGKTKEKWKQLRPDKPGVKTYGVPKMVGEEHWNWDAQSGDLAIVQSFVAKVKSRQFPAEQNSFHPYNGKPLDEVLTPLMARSEMRKDLPTNDGSGKKLTARDWISGWFAPWTLKNEEMRAMQARIEKVSQHVKKEGGLLVIASTLMHMLILILGVLSKTIALGDFSGILVMAGTVIYALSMQTVNTLTKEALRLRDKTSQGPYLWTDFPYSRTQNPVYLGYILGTALIVIAVPSFFGVLNLTVLTVWSIARIIYERVELWNETEGQALKEAKKKTKNRKITQRQKLQRQIEEVPVFLPGTKWLERIVERAVTRRRSEQRSHTELENFLENAATIAWPDKEPFQAAYKHAFERLRNHLNKIKTGDGPIQFNFTEEPRVMDSLAYWQSRIRSIQEDVKTTSEAEDFWLEALTFEYELMLRAQVVGWRGEENLDEWIQYLSGWSDALDRLTAELIKRGRFTKFQEFAKTRYVSFEGLYESKEEKIDSEMLELIFDEALTDISGLDESSLTFDFQKQMKDRSASDKAAMTDIEKVRWLEQFKNRMAYEMLFKPKLAPVLAEPASRLLANWRDLYSDRWNPFWESTYSGILSSVSKNQDQIKRRLGIAAIHPPARSEARSFEELNISALPLSSSLRSKANLIFPAVNVKTMGDLRGVPDQVLREAKSSTGQFSFTHEEILAVRAAVINFERAYQNQQEQQKILHAQESQDRQEKFVNRTRIKELRSRILSQKFDMGVYLAYLMLKPAGETWAQYLDGMPDFTGTKGKVDKYGLVKFSVFTGRQFVWRVLGFSDNQEREIKIIEARILSDNLFEFKVLMTVSGSEPIERIFQIGPHKEKLAKTSGHEGRERWVLKISDQLGLAVYDDEINALRSLAELVSNPVILVSPQKVNWTKILPKILSLKGVRLGETNANGVLNFTPAAGHQFVWSILGFSEKGWRAQIQDVFVDQGNLKVAILLENAQTKKSRKKTLQKVFQVGPSTRKVSHGEGLPESVSYLDLSERVALRDPGEDEHDLSTLKGLIRHPDFVENPAAIDWEKVRAGLPQLAGQALGVTAKNGTISFRPWLGYQNIQFSMGFMGEGWVATVESAEISSFGKFEVIVRFDSPKKNGTSIYRVYQFGPITRDVNRDERVLPTEDVHVSAKKVLMPLEAPALSLSNSGQDMTLADFLANQEQKKNSKTTNWKKREKDLQVLVGQSLGLSSAGGRFDFTLFSYFSAYEWAALGFREAGWRGVISRAEVNSHGILEISVQFKLQKGFSTKQPFHVFEKTFQVGPYVRKLVQVTASGRVPNGEERYVLNLDDSPAVKTFSDQGKKLRSLSEWLVYRPFLKDPKKINWEKQRSVMKKIEGLVIGTSTKQGVYYFNALPGYTFAWPALGRPEAGWKAVVDKFELNEFGKPELTVEFTKNGEESFKRTFQLTPYKQTLHPAKGFKDKDEVGLSLSLRPAITASSSEAEATIETAATLVDLLKLPDGFDWEKNKDQMPDLVGWRLGTTGKNGVYSLVAVANHKTVPWKAIEEEGAEGVIVEQSIREGHFYFKVRFTQGEGEAAEIFEREYEIQDTFYKLSGLGKKQGVEPVYMRKILPAVRSEMRIGAADDASDSAAVKWLVPHLGKDAQRIHTALLSGGLRKLSDIKQKTDEQVLTAINLYAGQNPHGMDDVKKIRRAVLLARVDWIDQENNLRKQKNHELLENQNTFLFLESRRNALLENILKQKEPPENLLKDYFAYLVLKPDQISWEAYLEPLAKIQKKLRGKIGVIHQRNLINFSPLDSRKYSWMLASQKEADWFGYSAWLKDVRFGRGKLELVVEIKDENERIAKTKIFQVGPYRKKIRAVRKKAVDLLTIEENTAVAVTRDGIHDFRTLSDVITDPRLLLQGDSINWSPHRAKIKNLVGLRIAPLDDRGGTVFNPVAGFNSYSWSALGSHDAGWAGVIESAEIRDGRFVFSVSFEKKGEPVRSRQFIIRGNRRELSAYDSDAKTSVLEIEPFELAWKKSINVESETITALPQLLTQSELIDSPARIKEIAARLKIDLPRNVPLGKSDSQGGFSFVVYPGYRDFYILSGRQEPGWEGTLVEGSMNRWGYYEIRVRFDKKFGGETESFEKVFQLAPLIFQFKKDNEAESQSADYKPVLSLHPRPALEKSGAEEIRTLTDLVGHPSFVKGYKKINWNDYIEALQILVGQSIGESPANGEYQFRPSEGQTYFWRPLKLADEGWRGIISKISVSAAGILEMEIEFEKAGEKQIRKFQIGTHLKELRSASAENEASKQYALSILDRPAIQVLSELITLKPDSSGSYNWEKKEAAVHSLKGLSLGVSSRGGTYWFNPYPDFGFDWRAVGLDEEGWLGTILNSQINFAGVPEFEVEFSKEGKESFRRIFQIAPFQRSLIMNERAKQRKAKERTAFEITDRAALVRDKKDPRKDLVASNLTDIIRLPINFNWRGQAEKLPVLRGLRLGKISAVGRYGLTPYEGLDSYLWQALSEKEAQEWGGAEGTIVDSEWNEKTGHFEFEVLYEKTGAGGQIQATKRKYDVLNEARYLNPKKRGRADDAVQAEKEPQPILKIRITRSEVRGGEGVAPFLSRSEILIAKIFAAGFLPLDTLKYVLGMAPESHAGLWASLTSPEKQAKEVLFAQSILFGKQTIQTHDAFVLGTELALERGFLAAAKKVFPDVFFAVIAKDSEKADLQTWLAEQNLSDFVVVAKNAQQAKAALLKKNAKAIVRGLAIAASFEADTLSRDLPVMTFTSGQLDRMLSFAGVVAEAARLAQFAKAFASAA